jgi:hypothetical protein
MKVPLASLVLLALALPQCSVLVDSATRPAHRGADAASAVTPDAGTSETSDAPADVDVPAVTPDVPPPRFDPAAACISDTRWSRGNRGSPVMNPGRACLECHRRDRDAPIQSVAGTAYYVRHEADLCNGYSGDPPGSRQGAATVRLIDANGVMLTLPVNAAGNFFTDDRLAFPLRLAEVIGPTGLRRAMGEAVPHGDCNLCHTRQGTDTPTGLAPGRIIVPLP